MDRKKGGFRKGMPAGNVSNSTDQKTVVTERRRRQMKWCEEQRYKVQSEVQELMDTIKDVRKIRESVLADSQWLSEIRQSVVKQMQANECNGPIPDIVLSKFEDRYKSDSGSHDDNMRDTQGCHEQHEARDDM